MNKTSKIIITILLIVLIAMSYYCWNLNRGLDIYMEELNRSNLELQNLKGNIANLFNKPLEIPNNIYVKEEMINKANTTTTTETYKKDNIIYQHVKNDDIPETQDIIWNYETKKIIEIESLFKNIHTSDLLDDTTPLDDIFISFNLEDYKYLGQENINGKNCYKFSLSRSLNNLTYFYVGTDDNLLYQMEEGQYFEDKFNLYYKHTYSYSFDTVTDEDILKFDENNYPDYTFHN